MPEIWHILAFSESKHFPAELTIRLRKNNTQKLQKQKKFKKENFPKIEIEKIKEKHTKNAVAISPDPYLQM